MSRPKVKIHYGILSGERMGRRLRKALMRDGFEITRRESEADIIIGHSAGCFWLPTAPTQQKLVLIDPPYWPGRTVKERAQSRMKSNFRFRRYGYRYDRWLKRNTWGMYYALRDLKRTRRIMRHAPFYNLSEIIKNHQVLLIRNEDDDWLTPNLLHLDQAHPGLVIRELPGDHEDWYHNPQPYVDLIRNEFGATA